MLKGDFFDAYFTYIGRSKAPIIYQRWAAISMIGALLGRKYYLPFGHSNIYPNHYVMLIGPPGAGKGVAMGPVKTLLQSCGYFKFGPDRTSPERFAIDLNRSTLLNGYEFETEEEIESINLSEVSQLYVLADEFADFIGIQNMNFINMLTKLWDNAPEYEHPKIHGKSIKVIKPTVNILCGTNPTSLLDAVPTQAIGQGFTARFIVIHSEGGEKVTWPDLPKQEGFDNIVAILRYITDNVKGSATISSEAKPLLSRMDTEFKSIDDPRFQHYCSRRFAHLLKLCLVLSAMRGDTIINAQDAIHANTILSAAEKVMPRALGELGTSRFSRVTNTVLELIHTKNLTFRELWRHVHHDLDKESDLNLIMRNLQGANKIQVVKIGGRQVFKRNLAEEALWDKKLVDTNFLTREELL